MSFEEGSQLSPFREGLAQQILTNVRTSGYMRDFDVFRMKQLLEHPECPEEFALRALLTLAQRSLPHFETAEGSAALELQLRAMAAAMVCIRSRVKQLSRTAHAELQNAIRELDDFCQRDLKLYANPNVEFLMYRVKKDTLALKNDGTKTDVAIHVGLTIGAAVLKVYGKDLLGAISTLDGSSLEWNQAWDAFLSACESLRSVLTSPGAQSAAENVVGDLLKQSMDAYDPSSVQSWLDAAWTRLKGGRRRTLIAFQLLDAFQEQYSTFPSSALAGQAGDIARSFLVDLSADEGLRIKAIELLLVIGSQNDPTDTLDTVRSLYERRRQSKDWNRMHDSAQNKRVADIGLERHLVDDISPSPSARSTPVASSSAQSPFPSRSPAPRVAPKVPAQYDSDSASPSPPPHIWNLPDGSRFEGPMVNGVFHGNGVWIRPDGERRAGQFQRGFLNGEGRVDYANGNMREGTFQRGYQRSGVRKAADGERQEGEFDEQGDLKKGKLIAADGVYYEGEFRQAKLVGKGLIAYPSGKVKRVQGTFKYGVLHGKGRIEYRNGDFRDGAFKTGKQLAGVFQVSEGDRLEGEFDDYGNLTRGSLTGGGVRQDGAFINGKLNGYGLIIRNHGRRRREEGMFKNGQLFGHAKTLGSDGRTREGLFEGYAQTSGVLTFPDGVRHQGRFSIQNGELVEGIMILANGDRLEGTFVDGQLNGYGLIRRSEGTRRREEGIFKDGMLEGQGAVTYGNGDRREGRFERSRFAHGVGFLVNGERHEGEFDMHNNLRKGSILSADGQWREVDVSQ